MPSVTQPFPSAALLILGSSVLFASMGALIKLVAPDLGNVMVVFFRNAFGLVALLPWIWRARGRGLRRRHLHLHLIRDGAGFAAMVCFFYAIPRLDLASAMLLNYSAPLFIPFIACIWLKEPLVPKILGAVLTGFAGLLLILKPHLGLSLPALLGLLSGVLAAVAMVGIRRMAGVEPAFRTVFYFSLFSTLASAVALAGIAAAIVLGGRESRGLRWLAYLGFAFELCIIYAVMMETMLGTAGFFLAAAIILGLLAFVIIRVEKRMAGPATQAEAAQ